MIFKTHSSLTRSINQIRSDRVNYTHQNTKTHTKTQTHACMHAHTHARTHACTHTHTHTHTHTLQQHSLTNWFSPTSTLSAYLQGEPTVGANPQPVPKAGGGGAYQTCKTLTYCYQYTVCHVRLSSEFVISTLFVHVLVVCMLCAIILCMCACMCACIYTYLPSKVESFNSSRRTSSLESRLSRVWNLSIQPKGACVRAGKISVLRALSLERHLNESFYSTCPPPPPPSPFPSRIQRCFPVLMQASTSVTSGETLIT